MDFENILKMIEIHFINQWKKSMCRDFDMLEFAYIAMTPLKKYIDYKGFAFRILGIGFNFWFKNKEARGR